MSQRIQKNSLCICGSGKMYKQCCGKGNGVFPTSSIFIGEEPPNLTTFDKQTLDKYKHYPRDYISEIKPIEYYNDIFYVLIDESNLNNYYAVSGILVMKSEIDNNLEIQSKLTKLAEKYNIDYIHFTDIFGRSNVLKDRKREFLQEYTDIVKQLHIKAFAVCMNKEEIKKYLRQLKDVTTEQCYIALTYKVMFKIIIFCIYHFGINLVFEMWREQENVTVEKRILHQENIRILIKNFPFANISIYRHYIIFMKIKLLYSSLSDFIAYFSIKTLPKIYLNYDKNRLVKRNYYLLNMFNEIFEDSTGIKNGILDELLEKQNTTKKYIQKNRKDSKQ